MRSLVLKNKVYDMNLDGIIDVQSLSLFYNSKLKISCNKKNKALNFNFYNNELSGHYFESEEIKRFRLINLKEEYKDYMVTEFNNIKIIEIYIKKSTDSAKLSTIYMYDSKVISKEELEDIIKVKKK